MAHESFRYCGVSHDDDPINYTLPAHTGKHPIWLVTGNRRVPAPRHVPLKDGGRVAQWAPTARSKVTGFNPASDCKGNFTPFKFQINNNCYNYACNIATNSFAFPGRKHSKTFKNERGRLTADSVIAAAEADGLRFLGGAEVPLAKILQSKLAARLGDGHFAALLISPADSSIRWTGDFHFVRCDSPKGDRWSHKSGRDPASNLDFQGDHISDPSKSFWTINQGPFYYSGEVAKQTQYVFYAWLYVPFRKVQII